uniref:VWFC domain-containing protein n=1 Tax=Scytodes thoracica TaxID=1112478 RepID=A0A0A0V5I1_SCYTH|nr:conserved hypothetical protein [Scytodes thoracica]
MTFGIFALAVGSFLLTGTEAGRFVSLFRDPGACSCDERYFRHYTMRRCKPVYEEGCNCPVRFECPQQIEEACYYEGKTYQIGEAVETSSPCEKCKCSELSYRRIAITCKYKECPADYRYKSEGCHPTYELNSCCAKGTSCSEEKVCEYGGMQYKVGQHMDISDNPCISCICDESWNGISNSSCRIETCPTLDQKWRSPKEYCIPIYHETRCCPIGYHCETKKEEVVSMSSNNAEPDPVMQCVFGDKRANVGDILELNENKVCVTCMCSTPPEFTCIQKSCPRPPNNDYANCKSVYTDGVCCPTYKCKTPGN